MNINSVITKPLIKENQKHHEDSKCRDCRPGLSIRGSVWVKKADLASHKKAGMPIFFDGENVLLAPISHALVTGSTGTGKTEVFYKNVLHLLGSLPTDVCPSFLTTDLKGDISEAEAAYLRSRGYEVVVLDMRRPFQSARYNFLLDVYDAYHEALEIKRNVKKAGFPKEYRGVTYPTVKEAKEAAECHRLELLDEIDRSLTELSHIVLEINDPKDRTWVEGARTMLRAIIFTMLHDSENPKNGLTREHFTFANVCRVAFSTGDDCEEICEWLEPARANLTVQSAITGNYKLRAKVTRDGYVSTLNTALAAYTSNAMGAITATADDISLSEIASSTKPYAIFLITDDRQKTTNTLAMAFINNLLNKLISAADSSRTHSLSRDFIVLADEFANMPAMPNLTNKITTMRSRRIWMVMAIQSAQQLERCYDPDTAAILHDNCDLHIFIGCNNDETKEAFCRSMGRKAGVKTSFNISNEGSMSASKTTEDVPVVRKSDLDILELGQFYVRARKAENLRSYMIPYFMQDHEAFPPEADRPFRKYDPKDNIYDIYAVLKRRNGEGDIGNLFNVDI